jgi:hypothetical protein
MRARLRPSVLGALLVGTLAVAACGLRPTASEPDLGVPNPGGGGDLYPGAIIVCGPLARCDDLVAEIRRWAARRAPEHGDPAGITIHAIVDDAGRPVLIQRSGGGTSIAARRRTSDRRAKASGFIALSSLARRSATCFSRLAIAFAEGPR